MPRASSISTPPPAPRVTTLPTISRREDLHLDKDKFQALCTDRGQADRGYLNEPWVKELFPDLTVRNRLHLACHDWAPQPNPLQQAQACDLYGNCTNVSLTVNTSAAELSAQEVGEDAKPVIVWPLAGSVIAVPAPSPCRWAAASSVPLQEMALMNMQTGQVFSTLNFAQADGVKRTVQTHHVPRTRREQLRHRGADHELEWHRDHRGGRGSDARRRSAHGRDDHRAS